MKLTADKQGNERRGMRKQRGGRGAALAFVALLGAGACETVLDKEDGFSGDEWDLIRELEPLKGPQIPNPANKWWDNEDAAHFGQMLFWDPDFSTAVKVEGPSGKVGDVGKISCGSCHDPLRSWTDSRQVNDGLSHGVSFTSRNSPSLLNLGWYEWFTWAGRLDSLSMQGANAPEAGTDVATTRLFYAHVAYEKYRDDFMRVFGFPLDPALDPAHAQAARFPPLGRPKASPMAEDGPWEKMTAEDRKHVNTIMAYVGKAIEAYERKLVSRNSRFEQYVKGNHNALWPLEKEGLRLFIGKASCNDCHRGPILSDNKFYNIGVPQAVGRAPAVDHGRFEDIPKLLANPFNGSKEFSDDTAAGMKKLDGLNAMDESTKGKFRTPSLLNISDTSPYFHNGSVRTLEEVVSFYNKGGGAPGTFSGVKDPRIRPLGLSAAEERALVAFLGSLLGELVPDPWRDDTHKRRQ